MYCVMNSRGLYDESDLTVQDLPSKDSIAILARLHAIEKKTFPANEIFNFDLRILAKRNTSVLYISLRPDPESLPIAYAVYIRWRSVLLLQKLCVAASFRGKQNGKMLMLEVINRARRARCIAIELWVG